MANKTSRPTSILGDHKRVGKRFIPPFVAHVGGLHEVHWPTEIVPELLWLALLNDRYGWQRGADLARLVGTAAHGAHLVVQPKVFETTSAFCALDDTERRAVVAAVGSAGALDEVRDARCPLRMFYDECPLNFLVQSVGPDGEAEAMNRLKKTIESLFDRRSKAATCAQANAIYIAFSCGLLKVMKGLALANFPAIEKYPNDEESRRVAGAVRAAVNASFLGNPSLPRDPAEARWRTYFWTRGLELEPCSTILD